MALELEKVLGFLRSDFKNVFIIGLAVCLYGSVKWGLEKEGKYEQLLIEDNKLQIERAADKESLFFKQVEITRAWKEINAVTSQELEKYNIHNSSPFDADSSIGYGQGQRRR